ncbi:pyridoxamine 5'-phosphate oxidase family protein [Sporichthya sp.]|uniref:pyridoxamine 5'-phosphate oxidase family protein n=1 Tax=Sporichthya sp. TaxID=65475 RepID=UPI00179DB64B|nr:pyridoxamine 5'-phosphate oxidase family protein [Sporichthya sp.]MBA3743010.1 pyridoxamine 5'-phosphate oxidase family protein [Sporichthya sp.]
MSMGESGLPGSEGEHAVQEQWDAVDRARTFYDRQMLDHLNEAMREFIARQEMVFVATADSRGECDSSFRAGEPGFVVVLDEKTVVYPELRGNGVYASLGNIAENAHVGLMFVDFFDDLIGLHVNGSATIVEHEALLGDERVTVPLLEMLTRQGGRRPERWVAVQVHEAYIHCSKHIPRLTKVDRPVDWGTDDAKRKGGDYFGVAETKGLTGPAANA